ncbi:Hypoxanthine phosphoribosyltransferase [Maioricimonas rarisocia]|uniref:Hypoxanthine phosphoribosyltransferase n=1 Tax=Maioricimonas rarisocia TaxID=2528026 RepID=A0A517Z7V6_9PLAN|nr:hypoxanthine phosphoribosyltransferase [Maioricimonas rarisocia]QDU38557.1 Hypoxanthine phosphoribosyltransferase [Maioricimonas rarisocia]
MGDASRADRQSDAVRPMIAADKIAEAVRGLGRQITSDYVDRPLTLLGVLSGSIMFVSDLMRQIELPHQLGLIQASSYRGTATEPDELSINDEFLPNLADRHVVLVDDIFDTGNTMLRLMHTLERHHPASLKSAVLLWKKDRTRVELTPDYHCFEIPDAFVVGYGLDYNDEYRYLPYVGVVQTHE